MYRFTYENQGSDKFLIYQLKAEEELDTMALGMLTHNKIPNLLPVSFTQVDSERYLRYSGLSQSTLKGQLGGIITRDRLLTIFDSVCEGIRISEEYFLDGNAFVLDAENIYIDRASGKTSLIYLPIFNQQEQADYVGFFKNIITNVIVDPSEDGGYITKLLYFLNSTENFSLTEFSRLVKGLRKRREEPQERREVQEPARKAKPVQKKATGQEIMKKSAEMPLPKPAVNSGVQPFSQGGKNEPVRKSVMAQAGSGSSGEFAGSEYGFDIPGKGPVKKPDPKTEELSEDSSEDDKMSVLQLLRNFSGENLEKYKKQNQESTEKKKETKKKKESREGGRTAKKKKDQGLILVSTDPAQPYTFQVQKDRFTIGRKETNDAVLKNILSISREHCVIIRKENEYFVEDMGSKFGTKVDGIPCVPGKRSAALEEQSVIEFAEIGFRVEFRQ